MDQKKIAFIKTSKGAYNEKMMEHILRGCHGKKIMWTGKQTKRGYQVARYNKEVIKAAETRRLP